MDIDSLDIRLLTVFEAVMRERSLTRAAAQLGSSQPAVSQSLARLRRFLGDPLFVRAGASLEPTPRALEIAAAVRTIVATAREQLAQASSFDRKTTRRVFSVYSSDAGNVIFVGPMVRALSRLAPNCRVRAMPIDDSFPDCLASGDADIALGSFPALGAGFYQQRLYEDSYVCLARAGHPLIGAQLTSAAFLASPHVVVLGAAGHAHKTVEKRLLELLPPDRIIATVTSFLSAPAIAVSSDCIATVPGRSGRAMAKAFGLRVLTPPIPLPRFEVKQYWHERYHLDPGNRWLRAQTVSLLQGREAKSPA